MSVIKVGVHSIPVAQAEQWLGDYFNEARNRIGRDPYAFPAYDDFNAGSGSNELNDGDLLAPGMLNAGPTIAAFYSLQRIKTHLQEQLGVIDPTVTLADAVTDGSVDALLGALVDVLDDESRPHGVRLTTLLKVLHRKRPLFIPLYDQYVKACYVGPNTAGFPVPPVRARLTSAYCVAVAKAINNDLVTQDEAFSVIRSGLPKRVPPLRVIDVLAWKAGRTYPSPQQ